MAIRTNAPRGPAAPAPTAARDAHPPAGSATTTPPKAGWTPGPRGAATAVAAKVTDSATEALRSAGQGPYELTPGRLPDAVGLPQVLAQLGASPAGQAAVGKILDALKSKAGIAVPPNVQAALLSNPSGATKALEVTPGQLQAGIVSLNAAYKAGKVKQAEVAQPFLPQHFDLASIGALDLPRPAASLKELAPGLYTGDLPSALPDAQVKQNRVMAEVFDRLSANASAPAEQRFDVSYGGKTYARLDDFLGALKADGYRVDVSFDQRAANFADLKTLVPGSTPPKYLDVPAPLMVKTGFKDAAGHEAIVPAAHSQMVISLRAGPDTSGPKLDSDTRFFQGINGTGFFPDGVWADPTWVGKVTHGTLSGDQALKAVELAGAFTDLVNSTAKAMNLYGDGYGITGVCNDSVAVVQQAMTGRADEYPLLMKDEVLYGELKKRLSAKDADVGLYQDLGQAIRDLPSDARPNATARARALASLSWAPGAEPFDSTAEARRILMQ